MKRYLTTAILSIAAVAAAFAQDSQPAQAAATIDRQHITATAGDRAAYKALADRFAAGHKMQPQEVADLYYGSALQPGFKADRNYPEITRSYVAGDYATTLSQVWNALSADPTNLYLLFTGYGAARSLGNKEAAGLLQNRLLQICDVIFSSGKGVSQDSPYIVVRPGDIDEFLIKYIQPTSLIGRAKIGNVDAARVNIDGVPDDVILYFKQF